jgi:hypothetical protein
VPSAEVTLSWPGVGADRTAGEEQHDKSPVRSGGIGQGFVVRDVPMAERRPRKSTGLATRCRSLSNVEARRPCGPGPAPDSVSLAAPVAERTRMTQSGLVLEHRTIRKSGGSMFVKSYRDGTQHDMHTFHSIAAL